jgi:hypothetical protein
MASTFAEFFGHRGRLVLATVILATVSAVFAVTAAPADAYSGRYYDLANIYNTDADVKIYWGAYANPNTKAFDVVTDTRAATKDDMYVQFRELRTGYNFSWKRLSNDVDKGRTFHERRYHTSQITINAYQVRLCHNGVFSDTCGATTTIYRYQ